MTLYSVVVPIFNEADNILALVEELEWVMHCHKDNWELLFVDDGSTDKTQSILHDLHAKKPYIRFIRFKQNFGQTSAFAAGVKASLGTWVISLDGDLQNDPRDIPLLITTCQNGNYDLVGGKRVNRRDPWYKKVISKTANAVRRRVLQDETEDTGCSLKMYRRSCFDTIPLFNGMHRFLPALFQIEGYRTTTVAVNHRPRRKGKSKYHLFNRGFALFVDLLAVAWMRKRRLRYEIEK